MKDLSQFNRDLGALIRQKRIARGYSQQALGKLMGVSFQQMQKYEKGLNSISAGRLAMFCEAMEEPFLEFFTSATFQPPEARRARERFDLQMMQEFRQLPEPVRIRVAGLLRSLNRQDSPERQHQP